MNTVTITEESAIIPLTKLNEYKEHERLLSGIMNGNEKYVSIGRIAEYSHDFKSTKYTEFFQSTTQALAESKISKYFENEFRNKVETYKSIQKSYEREIEELKEKVDFLSKELKKSEKPFWKFW